MDGEVLEKGCHALLERDVSVASPAESTHLWMGNELEDFLGTAPWIEIL